jgi:hypothetical protein
MNGLMMPPQGMMPPAPQGGLLGMPGMDPQKMGLLAAAFQGLKASGNSRMPVTLGQTIGEAGTAGMDAMRQGTQDQMKQQLFGQQQQMHSLQMAEHAAKVKRTQEMEALMPLFAKDPAAAMMARSGDFKGAIERLYPKEEFDVQQTQGPKGPMLSYIPKRPGVGQVTSAGVAPYQAALDPAARGAKIEDAVRQESLLTPIKVQAAIDSGAPGREVTMRGQDMSQGTAIRGQNMTDSRARDANAVAGVGAAVKTEAQIRDDYRKDSGDFVKVRDAHQRVLASAKDPSAAGDLALIFNYMKVLDPGSTVREGEFATAQNSGSIPDRIISQYNKAIRGERLAPNIRKDFVDRSGRLYSDAEANQKKIETQYRDITTRSGGNPDNVVMPQRVEAKNVVRRGKYQGKDVVEYSDGTVEYK